MILNIATNIRIKSDSYGFTIQTYNPETETWGRNRYYGRLDSALQALLTGPAYYQDLPEHDIREIISTITKLHGQLQASLRRAVNNQGKLRRR